MSRGAAIVCMGVFCLTLDGVASALSPKPAGGSVYTLDRPVCRLEFPIGAAWKDTEGFRTAMFIEDASAATEDVKVVFSVETVQNWRYQTAALVLKPAKENRIHLSFDPGRHDWIPSGHYRPWDRFAHLSLASVGLKVFSRGRGLRLHLDPIQPDRKTMRKSCARPALVDGAWTKGTLFQVSSLLEYHFDFDKDWTNPFDPRQVRVDVSLQHEHGQEIIRPAFYHQAYLPHHVAQEHLVPVGPSGWCVRFVPRESGTYMMTVMLTEKEETCKYVLPPIRVRERTGAATAPLRKPPPGRFLHAIADRPGFLLRDHAWDPVEHIPGPRKAWRIPLEWRAGWGTYRGLGWINLEQAYRLDQAMQNSTGIYPFLLFADEECGEHGMYRWQDNPLNRNNDGPLTGPSEQYRNRSAYETAKRQLRYVLARWGHHPAVSGIILGGMLPAAGASRWHDEMADCARRNGVRDISIYSLHPEARHRDFVLLAGFERQIYPWRIERRFSPDTTMKKSYTMALQGRASLRIKGRFPGEAAVYRVLDSNWSSFDTISMDLYVSRTAPPYMRVMVFLRDDEGWWYQTLRPDVLRNNDWNRILVPLDADKTDWQPYGHARPWSPYSLQRIRQIGIRIFGHAPSQGEVYLDSIRLLRRTPSTKKTGPSNRFVWFREDTSQTAAYQCHELNFALSRTYDNPFDPEQVDIRARFIDPGGKVQDVLGFFYQDYQRTLSGEEEKLIPSGSPYWKIRFTPTQCGRYTYTVRVKDREETILRKGAFDVQASDARGFIRRSRSNPYYFEFDDGSFYYPIGINLRSPSDSRQPYRYPFKLPAGQGTYVYDAYLQRMQENGMNWARIWMSAWWCGLEWRKDWPGFQGIGRYNMQNAWRLDYLVEQAGRRGVYFQLCTTNHGMFSPEVDSEWRNNPFHVALGGPLRRPGDYFTNPAAIKKHRDRLRYTIARWAYSPAIFSWGLMSEVEYTGIYWWATRKNTRPKPVPAMTQWHRDAADWIRSVDPWHHLVTTHFSHPNNGGEVWRDGRLDYSQSNAYSVFQELGHTDVIHAIDNYTDRFMGRYSKLPVLIGEYGGHWAKNSMESLDAELHAGLWTCVTQPRLAGNTGFWWWLHVHYQDRYWHYRAVSAFMQDEDLREGRYARTACSVVSPENRLRVRGIDNGTRVLLWVYPPDIARSLKQVARLPRSELMIENIRPGRYVVQFWDTYAGRIRSERTVKTAGETLRFRLPSMRLDLAVKCILEE